MAALTAPLVNVAPGTGAWAAPHRDTIETALPAFTVTTDDEGTWVWVPVWAQQAEDPALLRALQIASTFNRPWREQVAVYLAARDTRISFGPLPPGAGGAYDAAADRIILADAVRFEPPGVLAALLAHEVYHAVIAKSAGAHACLDEETYAFSWQASTWSYLPDHWRGRTSWSRWHDFLVHAWRDSALAGAAGSLPGYAIACGAPNRP